MKSCSSFLLIILAVIAGLALGLLVGWVIWPVQWIDASPEDLRLEFQVEWINMAIDSYSVNQNASLATERYDALGADAPAALDVVLADPKWVSGSDAQAYAAVVGAPGAETTPTAETTWSTLTNRLFKPPLFGYVVVALFLALIAIVLLVILVVRLVGGKQEEKIEEAPGLAAEAAADVQVEGEMLAEEITPAEVAVAAEEVVAVEPVEEESGGLLTGAAVLAGAAVVADALHDEPPPEVEAEMVPEPEILEPEATATEVVRAVEEVAVAEAPLEGIADTVHEVVNEEEQDIGGDSGALGKSAALAAAAAGVEWALEKEEETPGPVEEVGLESEITESMAAMPVEEAEEVLEEKSAEGMTPTEESGEWLPENSQEELPADFYGKYNRKVIDIEGIGEAYATRLAEVGITTTHGLLQQCATSKGRDELVEKTGISQKLILEWANHADMMRVQGIGPQWSDLLEMAGVNTVRELALRNPENLHRTLVEINDEKKLVRQLPTQAQVEEWVEIAKDLPRILTY